MRASRGRCSRVPRHRRVRRGAGSRHAGARAAPPRAAAGVCQGAGCGQDAGEVADFVGLPGRPCCPRGAYAASLLLAAMASKHKRSSRQPPSKEAPPDQPLAKRLRLPGERMRQAFVRTRLLPDAPPPVSHDKRNPTHQAIPQAHGEDGQIRRLANLPSRGRNPRARWRNAESFTERGHRLGSRGVVEGTVTEHPT